MKYYIRNSFVVILVLLLIIGIWNATAETCFVFPESLQCIEEEAFYGICVDSIILPDCLITIGPRAFANSRIHDIHLSSSIEFIDDSAFEGAQIDSMKADQGTYAYDWAVRNAFIYPCPVTVQVDSIAGDDNPQHFHAYGQSHRFSGTITSTVAIREIRSAVVFADGDNEGQSAYDCREAVFHGGENVFSVDIRSSALNSYLKFGKMPCAPLRLYLFADLVNGNSFKIFEYDFEIIKKCTSVSLNYNEKKVKYGTGFWIIPRVSPADATYMNSFQFFSSNDNIASIDESGYVQAHNTSGTAIITVCTGDGLASASCTVTVTNSLLDSPQIYDYIAEDGIYDSLGNWIFLNYTEVEGAASYEFSRASSAVGPFSESWITDGLDTEYIANPFPADLFSFDSGCEEDTTYYYRVRAKSYTGEYSDYSPVFKANSAVIHWVDTDNEVWMRFSDTLVVPQCIDDESGDFLNASGTIQSNYELTNITASIYNEWGTLLTRTVVAPGSKTYQMSDIALNISNAENGIYKLVIKATANKETQVLSKTVFFIERTRAVIPTTEQLQKDIVSFVKSNSASMFNPEEEVERYLSSMSNKDIAAMALSDYTNIAIGWVKDRLTGAEYNSYMEKKYEAQIIGILDAMNSEGKIKQIKLSDPITNMIKSLNGLTKNGTKVRLDEINSVFEQYGGSAIDWNELEDLLIIKDECSKLSDLYDEVKAGEEFINIVTELFSNHAKDLEALNTVMRVYNSNGDPSFNEAMRRIRASYKTQFGSSLRMIFNKLEKELEKEAFKEITGLILTKSAGYLYSLADTIVQFTLKITGVTEAGKNRILFLTQYTTLNSFRRAYSNAFSAVVDQYAAGKMPTEAQIHQLQVTFQCTKQSLMQLYKTMTDLDRSNAGSYLYYYDQTEKMTMPGLDRLASGD